MAGWGTVLSGILAGAGNAGVSFGAGQEAQRKDRMEAERIAIERERMAQQQRQFDAAQTIAIPDWLAKVPGLEGLAQVLAARGGNEGGMGGGAPATMSRDLLPFALARADKQAQLAADLAKEQRARDYEQQDRTLLQKTWMAGQAQPGQPGAPALEGAGPTAGMIEEPARAATSGTPAMPLDQLKAALIGLKGGDALVKTLYPQDAFAALPENSPGAFNKLTGEFSPIDTGRPAPVPVGPAPPGVNRTVTTDWRNRQSTTDKPIEARDDFDRHAQQLGYARYEDAPPQVQASITANVGKFRGDIAARTGEGGVLGKQAAEMALPVGQDATKYIHPQTRQSPPASMPLGQVLAGGYMQIQHQADRTALGDLMSTKATVTQLNQMADKLITATTPMEAAAQGVALHAGALSKSNPMAATYYDTKQAFLGTLSRTLGGERGVLTNQDITRISGALAGFWDTVAVKDAKAAILQNLLETASEAKLAVMTGQPMGVAYQQRIADLIGALEKTMQGGGAPPAPGAGGWKIERVR